MLVNYKLRSRWHVGEVIKVNPKTIIVISPTGKAIKRHKQKHGVVVVQ